MAIAIGDRSGNTCQDLRISDSCSCGLSCRSGCADGLNTFASINFGLPQSTSRGTIPRKLQIGRVRSDLFAGHGAKRSH